jgi:hypothetical protein
MVLNYLCALPQINVALPLIPSFNNAATQRLAGGGGLQIGHGGTVHMPPWLNSYNARRFAPEPLYLVVQPSLGLLLCFSRLPTKALPVIVLR